jgi:S1-C subfamily serine protease
MRQQLGLAQELALIVVDVQAGSPAAEGLLIGDLVLSLDGHAITDPVELRRLLRAERIGRRITARVVRGGQAREVELTVGERPARSR